jgi:hypothetical protein
MAVMVTAEVPGQTREGYDMVRAGLGGPLKSAPGLILHTSHAVEGGWRVIEIWDSTQAANDFFAKFVHPNLPPGIKPRRTFQELHAIVQP